MDLKACLVTSKSTAVQNFTGDTTETRFGYRQHEVLGKIFQAGVKGIY